MIVKIPTDKLKTNKERLDWIEDSIFARKLSFWLWTVTIFGAISALAIRSTKNIKVVDLTQATVSNGR